MLTKLLKYDLKYMIRNMSVFYILGVIFAVAYRITSSLSHTVMFTIINNITLGCFIAILANILINTIMRSWVRFRDSLYKDESYLTHTLPVTKNEIYNSRFIQSLIVFTISFIIMVVCLFIAFYTKENWQAIRTAIEAIVTSLNFKTSTLIISFLAIIFLEIFNTIQCGYLGIILGHKQNNGKLGLSVVFGFASYSVCQTIVAGMIFFFGLFNKDFMALYTNENMMDINSFKALIVLSIIIYTVMIIVMSIISKKVLNKGVNVE